VFAERYMEEFALSDMNLLKIRNLTKLIL
jgi:hypothetical protein